MVNLRATRFYYTCMRSNEISPINQTTPEHVSTKTRSEFIRPVWLNILLEACRESLRCSKYFLKHVRILFAALNICEIMSGVFLEVSHLSESMSGVFLAL